MQLTATQELPQSFFSPNEQTVASLTAQVATTGVYPLLLPLNWPGTPSCHAMLSAVILVISVWQGSCAAGLRAAYHAAQALETFEGPNIPAQLWMVHSTRRSRCRPAATGKRAYRLKVAASSERFFCPQLGRPPQGVGYPRPLAPSACTAIPCCLHAALNRCTLRSGPSPPHARRLQAYDSDWDGGAAVRRATAPGEDTRASVEL